VALIAIGNAMKVAEIVRSDGSQSVRLPEEFHLERDSVSIRRQGEAIILEPIKSAAWPPGFFDRIRVEDPAFERPPQGQAPPAPKLD
jgi:virulence-associated protein VagC